MTPEQPDPYQAAYEAGVKFGYEIGYKAGNRAARNKPWTIGEVNQLREWEGSDAELAVLINRSALAVKMKRHKLKKAGEF